MVKVSTLAIAGGSVLMAAAAGIYMQMSEPGAPKVAAMKAAPSVSPMPVAASAIAPADPALEMQQVALTSSDISVAPKTAIKTNMVEIVPLDTPSEPMAPIMASIAKDDLMLGTAPAPQSEDLTKDCTVDLAGENRAAAMVALHLAAPCQPNAPVTFLHEGMSFSAMTDAAGDLRVEVPALAEVATFLAMLDNGNGAAVEMEVDTLGFYDRSVVQWRGDAGFGIHAFEFGASWAGDGHVWFGAPREAAVAARGEGGFMTRLGDAGMDNSQIAEIYTFPTATAKSSGEVELSVEVEVTAANCGQDLQADVIEVIDGRAGKPGTLSLTVPGCDAVGDYIQLKNLVRDLKIAAR